MRALSPIFLFVFVLLVLLTQSKRELLLCILAAVSVHYIFHIFIFSNKRRSSPPLHTAVLVTGCSPGGIGEDAALTFSDLGFHVFATIRNPKYGEILKTNSGNPDLIEPIVMDVTNSSQINQAFNIVSSWLEKDKNRRLIAVINNAGYSETGPIEYTPISSLRDQFEVNVIGQIAVTQVFLPLLRKALPLSAKDKYYPRVVFVSSLTALFPTAMNSPYSASKAALENLVDGLRNELKVWGIHVVSVLPGAIHSKFKSKFSDKYLTSNKEESEQEIVDVYKKAYVNMVQHKLPLPIQYPYFVTRALVSAVMELNPSRRYLVGKDAHIVAWLVQLLPEPCLDFALGTLFWNAKKPEKTT